MKPIRYGFILLTLAACGGDDMIDAPQTAQADAGPSCTYDAGARDAAAQAQDASSDAAQGASADAAPDASEEDAGRVCKGGHRRHSCRD